QQDMLKNRDDTLLIVNHQIILKSKNLIYGIAISKQAIQAGLDVLAIDSNNDSQDYLTDNTVDTLRLCLLTTEDEENLNSDENCLMEPEKFLHNGNESLTSDLLQEAYKKDSISKEIFKLLKDKQV
ncbi:MAG: hypothetical protein M1839_009372, partial [Geoglossum umbratile]